LPDPVATAPGAAAAGSGPGADGGRLLVSVTYVMYPEATAQEDEEIESK
jgi:hypothetical protein